MSKFCFEKLETQHKQLIDLAKEYMQNISDFEHNIKHVNDVVSYVKKLMIRVDMDIDCDVCIIAAYWHDVGRTKTSDGHEKLSAEMLKDAMLKFGYDRCFIDKCYAAIENHKWNMSPKTIEGLIVKDADKLAWLGLERWNECFENNKLLNELVYLLPRLRNEILYFEESRIIYDEDIVNLVNFLYKNAFDRSL